MGRESELALHVSAADGWTRGVREDVVVRLGIWSSVIFWMYRVCCY